MIGSWRVILAADLGVSLLSACFGGIGVYFLLKRVESISDHDSSHPGDLQDLPDAEYLALPPRGGAGRDGSRWAAGRRSDPAPVYGNLYIMCRPLLSGRMADEAESSVRAIAAALRRKTPGIHGSSYASGEAGVALFYACLATISQRDDDAAEADVHLARMVEGLEREIPPPGLFNGLAGIAWTAQRVETLLRDSASAELTEEIDDLLIDTARTSPWPGHFDLIYGLVGLGIYAIHHVDSGRADVLLGLVIERLKEWAEEVVPGYRWHTPLHLIKREVERKAYPEGYDNLGLAHGIGGVIGLLAAARGRPNTSERARALLEGSVQWLLANKRLDDGGSIFSSMADDKSRSCRSGWCYGDPSLAWILLRAARAAQRPDWEGEALAIARRDAKRPFEASGVADAGLCHGAAGLGHIYHRMYQATEDPDFAAAARGWFGKVFDLRQANLDAAGYAAWWPEAKEWHADASLLTGAAGVGLALISATSTLESRWDQPLLLGTLPA